MDSVVNIKHNYHHIKNIDFKYFNPHINELSNNLIHRVSKHTGRPIKIFKNFYV